MRKHYWGFLALMGLVLFGCSERDDSANENGRPARAAEDEVTLTGDWDSRLTAEQVASGRLDPSWRRVVQLDTAGLEAVSPANAETWDQISLQTVNSSPMQLPLYEASEGPSVLRAQILLDRALFSPGIIDGHWGKNTEKAVYWFQYREGLRKSGRVDQQTFDRLAQLAAAGTNLVESYTLTAEDVAGPFQPVPEDIYEKEKLDCLCYESLTEKLGEMFHTSPEVLSQLNPGVQLNSLAAGQAVNVPNIREADAGRGTQIAKLVVSSEGFFVHALDASGRIVFHFPSTLGSSFDPSPSGNHSVVRITKNPWWHYQPAILAHVDDSEKDAQIPPGPNNAVGLVWMALSAEHYGIHGTSAPETIGYVTSAGCIRLTNWDALFLADRIAAGVPVEFRAGGAIAMSDRG